MKKGLTEIAFILDRSGSMSGLESDTIGGFNSMIEKQKKQSGEAYVSTVLFSTSSVTIHDRLKLENVPPMTEKEYFVGGGTALFDAVGKTIRHIEKIHKYIRPDDVPERTLVVITTDGLENASRDFNRADIKEMIGRKKENGWEFVFLGANIDAEEVAEGIGIDSSHAAEFDDDEFCSLSHFFRTIDNVVSTVRQGEQLSEEWKETLHANTKEEK